MNKVLLIGDSHMFHCFSTIENKGLYIIDITLNQIRKNYNLRVKYDSYDNNIFCHKYSIDNDGELLIDLINNNEKEYVLFSIGEIDIRFHLEKQLSIDSNSIINIINIYEFFLLKINKKVLVCSSIPPNKESLINLTLDFNFKLKKMCIKNNYEYIDLYTDFEKNGLLNPLFTKDNTHINSSLKEELILKNKIKYGNN